MSVGGDSYSGVTVNGNNNRLGSSGNTYNAGPAAPGNAPSKRPAGGGPVHTLYAFTDIVGWSGQNARLQKSSTSDLADFLTMGLDDVNLDPDQVETQDQGDARFLTFPAETDPAEVLAKLPDRMDRELAARNRDMAAHARMRVRMAFSMGASEPGATGRVGQAAIAVARLVNSDILRSVVSKAHEARCTVIIDSYLYEQCVQQRFRADLDPADWVPVRVTAAKKNFDAAAWIRLVGSTGNRLRGLLAEVPLA
jgi:hypothetical protein